MKIAHTHRYCASCFAEKPDMRYVDMEAYFDGPSMKQANGDYIAIDDLVVCEDCIREAASLVEMYPLADLKKENAEMGETIETKHSEIEELHATISDLTHSLQKISSEKILKPNRRPKIVEV